MHGESPKMTCLTCYVRLFVYLFTLKTTFRIYQMALETFIFIT